MVLQLFQNFLPTQYLYSSVGEQISHPLLLSLNPCLSFNPLQFQCLLWFLSYCQCQWFSRFGPMVTICLTRWRNLILSHFLEDLWMKSSFLLCSIPVSFCSFLVGCYHFWWNQCMNMMQLQEKYCKMLFHSEQKFIPGDDYFILK